MQFPHFLRSDGPQRIKGGWPERQIGRTIPISGRTSQPDPCDWRNAAPEPPGEHPSQASLRCGRLWPLDLVVHQGVEANLAEWNSQAGEEAFRDL